MSLGRIPQTPTISAP
uniref:Uncharacterized protein n=1 Tax=Anguilla anguilla TaxID=7936 RepID=A0A0E9Q073_ANGAN